MSAVRVGIVGGGLSGLYAAYLLQQLGIDYFVLEARTSFGGRILSLGDDTQVAGGNRFDLGATWFWPSLQPSMTALIEQLGLSTLAQYDVGDIVLENSRNEAPIRRHAIGLAGDSTRIAGGTIALIDRLVSHLPHDKLFFGHKVKSIHLDAPGINISVLDVVANAKTFNATHVLLAAPPRLLAQDISFEPALDQRLQERWKNTATWMAPHAKFVAVYAQPFWRQNGLSGMARSAAGPLVEIHDASNVNGTAALFGFFGWSADSRRLLNETKLREQCIAQLVRLFGQQGAQPEAVFFKDWAQDHMTATQADQFATAHTDADRSLQPGSTWQGYMQLISSEASMTFPGYLAGSLEAAEAGIRLLSLGQDASLLSG